MREDLREYRDSFGDKFDPKKVAPPKELAAQMQVSVWYVYAMRYVGFMPTGTASYLEAVDWLREFHEKHGRRFSAKQAMEDRKKERAKITPA